jgi:hypothetical protein
MIIYATDQKNRSSYYFLFNLIFTIVLLLDMIIRLFPVSRGDGINSRDVGGKESSLCIFQAITLTFFDKFIITLTTVFSIISYVDKCSEDFNEEDHKKKGKTILIILLIVSFFISAICVLIFALQNFSDRSQFCYVETENSVKIWVDFIVTLLLFITNLVFTLITNNRWKDKDKFIFREEWTECDLRLFYVNLAFNLITPFYVICLILRILPKGYSIKDYIYIILCLIVNSLFVIKNKFNKYIIKFFKDKCHCCGNDIKVNNEEPINPGNSNEDD